MYIQEISIAIKSDTDRAELVESFTILLSHYRGSGQIQGRIQSEYIAKLDAAAHSCLEDKGTFLEVDLKIFFQSL